jgi:insulysin
MMEFFKHYVDPSSPSRAKLAIYFVAQAKSDVSTKQISELIKTLDLDAETSAKAATDLQARLSAAGHDERKEVESLADYLLHELKVAENKIVAATETWEKLHAQNGQANGVVQDAEPPSFNGSTPYYIEDVRQFKSALPVSAGPRAAKDLCEYEELDPKL